ncbi:type II toxin-antitoxin system PemK/MazF family toxin, partial [Candidatus Woesearchaeota archaeon]|nr:type II toxin-antitoxin system PemK/MazF family toxin [Candidatus Woesearchaeota archaeon]
MKKGEVWLVEIPSSNGYEQLGNRPSAVIADTTSNVTVIIPFTSNIQALRFPFTVEVKPDQKNGLSAISVGLVFQIRAIDKKRLKKK